MNDRLSQLLDFLKNEPNDPFLHYALATEYVKKQEYQQALEYYLNSIRIDEAYVGTYYHLGKLYEVLQNKEEAEKTYKKGMEVARKKGQQHAFSELQQAYNKVMGMDYEDD